MKSFYKNGQDLFDAILKGVNKIEKNVTSTMGPQGYNVMIRDGGASPLITKDGVTVSRFIFSDCPFEQLAIDVIRQASEETNAKGGDGTTSSILLASAIIKEAQHVLNQGHHPKHIKLGLEHGLEQCKKLLKEYSKPIDSIETLENIALISSNGDKVLSKLICSAIEAVGRDGAITIAESNTGDTVLDIQEGFVLESGLSSPGFITDNATGLAKQEHVNLLITDSKFENIESELMPVLQLASRDSKPLVIVAEDFSEKSLSAMVFNHLNNRMKIIAIKAPYYGEERKNYMQDLAIASGAKFFQKINGDSLSNLELEHFGRCAQVECGKNKTVFVGLSGDSEEVKKRIDSIKETIKTQDLSHQEAKRYQERITKLSSAVAIIKLGAYTQSEMREKKDRARDALEAVISAQKEGVLAGGGITLFNISKSKLKRTKSEIDCGIQILENVLISPLKKLCENSEEISFKTIKNKLKGKSKTYGYDFSKKKYGDMFEMGVIDPTTVTKSALENAVSAASTLLTTNYSIVIQQEEK